MKIYTKKGDDGYTSLIKGERIQKNDPHIEFLGNMDELNSHLGLIKHLVKDRSETEFIIKLQEQIMTASAFIALSDYEKYNISPDGVSQIENRIDALQALYPPTKVLVLPGKTQSSSQIDIARTVARRTERSLYNILQTEKYSQISKFLNRLSDYLYTLARYQEFAETN